MLEPATGQLWPIATYARALLSLEKQGLRPPHSGEAISGEGLSREALAVWKQFRFNWLLLAIAIAIFDLCLLLTDFRIRPSGYLIVLAIVCLYGVCSQYNVLSWQEKPRVLSMLAALVQAILAVSVLTSLSYVATAADLPLRDSQLLAIDRTMGFDFRAVLNLVNDRGWLVRILSLGYDSIAWPIWLIVCGLPLVGHYQRAAEFVSALVLALAITCCITMLVPAIGVYHAMGLAPSDYPNIQPLGYYATFHEMPLLRAGTLRTLELGHLMGVVTFPSFHAATAVLYGWALWPLRWVRPLNLALNGTMLLATPIYGGHYLMDVLAGVTVAVGSICVAQYGAKLLDMLQQGRRPTIVPYRLEADMRC